MCLEAHATCCWLARGFSRKTLFRVLRLFTRGCFKDLQKGNAAPFAPSSLPSPGMPTDQTLA